MKKHFVIMFLMFVFLFPSKIYAEENSYLDIKIGKTYPQNQSVKIVSKENIKVIDKNFNEIKNLNSKEITATIQNGNITLKNNNDILEYDFPKDGTLLLKGNDDLKVGELTYRGYISFRNLNNNLNVVNHVELEDYLKGVVPKELSPSYPKDALKAQAICSRSFAIKNINKYKKNGYNLDDTTNSQVYRGRSVEDKRSNLAIEETRGIVAKYNDQIANTIFGASSGGKTANAAEVWGGTAVNYLSSFEDPYSKEYKWDYKLNNDEINKKLLSNNIKVGNFIRFNIIEKDISGRNKTIEVVGTAKTEKITGSKFRNVFGNTKLKSTLFDIGNDNNGVIFVGSGYGHGVGMSQYGAVEMAKQGKNYTEIMSFYFPGVTLK